jgi:hypothetical protein
MVAIECNRLGIQIPTTTKEISMKIRSKLGIAALSLPLLATSCLGPNNTFNDLHEWNRNVSEADWVNELVFLGCVIVPVYGIAYLVDIVALNTYDYWSGGSSAE